ncbi:condensation domain-containing protein, partial [Frankia sp. Ag45/Mut15]
EPGEVEAVLAGLPGVGQAVVVARTDAGTTRLIGYVVPSAGPSGVGSSGVGAAGGGRSLSPGGEGELDAVRLRAALGAVLPDYLVPSVIVVLPALPTTPNGKLDRRALPVPVRTGSGAGDGRAGHGALATATEQLVARLFTEVLGVEGIGPDDSFFALGGHSLLAARLIARVRTLTGQAVSIRLVFDTPTVARLAASLDAIAAAPVLPALVAGVRPDPLPLSAAQRRLWFLHRLDGPSDTYNLPFALRLTGELDIAALRAAFGDVVARHESLRTVFPDRDGVPYQRILTDVEVPFTVVDTDEAALPDQLRRVLATGLDLATQIPILVEVLRLGADDHVLALVIQHIAGDEGSTGPLLHDLTTAYDARRAGSAPHWTALTIQYADYAVWHDGLVGAPGQPSALARQQLDHWANTLDGLADAIALPVDRPRPGPDQPSAGGGRLRAEIPAGVMAALRPLLAETGASELMLAHLAVAATLHTLGAGTDIPLGALVAGRSDPALEPLVGFFVNTVVLRTDLGGDPTLRALLRRVRHTALDAYAHADVPFDAVVERLNPPRRAGRHPLVQTLIDFWNPTGERPRFTGLNAVPLDLAEPATAKFDLALTFTHAGAPLGDTPGVDASDVDASDVEARTPADGGLLVSAEYDADLFDRATVEALLARLGRVLAALARTPDLPLSRLDVLSPDERHQLTRVWSGRDVPAPHLPALTPVSPPVSPTVLDVWDRTVAAARADESRPGATGAPVLAVVCGSVALSFAEVDAAARRLAEQLAGRGVGPEVAVGVLLPRSVEVIVAWLAVWKAGGVVVPLDPTHPLGRLESVLAEARPAVVVTSTPTLRTLAIPTDADAASGFAFAGRTVLVDAPHTWTAPGRPSGPADADAAAYVVFTSGSTGRPKGVVATHGGL